MLCSCFRSPSCPSLFCTAVPHAQHSCLQRNHPRPQKDDTYQEDWRWHLGRCLLLVLWWWRVVTITAPPSPEFQLLGGRFSHQETLPGLATEDFIRSYLSYPQVRNTLKKNNQKPGKCTQVPDNLNWAGFTLSLGHNLLRCAPYCFCSNSPTLPLLALSHFLLCHFCQHTVLFPEWQCPCPVALFFAESGSSRVWKLLL